MKKRKTKSREDVFWSMVDKSGKCWNWIGSKYNNGYGQFYKKPMKITAHRYSYELVNGPVDRHLVVCHTCVNRSCVKPKH